jgi:tetratricopeptide (TPR) repeat protein
VVTGIQSHPSVASASSSGIVGAPDASAHEGPLPIGEVFGRYHVIRLLGSGGMGHVYHAWDQELGEAVALKVIRREYASSPGADARFKRELSVARQVTHKNVVRIHDLGQVGNVKFISMSFIEGVDLATMMAAARLPFDLALALAKQICTGLSAAHQVGVVHRDLKPGNIMVDRAGQAYLMDFGLARSAEAAQYTMTGVVMGTVDYLAPEQAKGEPADQRSDVYALGIILFELFNGTRPFTAETAMARLTERIHKPAPDPRTINAELPPYLSGIILRCLERDPALRYGSAGEVLADFEAHQTTARPWIEIWRRNLSWEAAKSNWKTVTAVVVLIAVALVAGGLLVGQTTRASKGATTGAAAVRPPTISLAILPFRNASGDPALDWLGSSLAEMLRTDVGQSARLRTVSAERVDQVLRDLHINRDATFDAAALGRLAEFSGAETLVWGQYVRLGSRIRLDVTLRDVKQSRTLPLKAEAADEKDIIRAVDELAQAVQQGVTTSPDLLKELRASAFKPSSRSLQALRAYNEGVRLARQGNYQEAAKQLEASTKEDPEFALAYSQLGQAYANLGYDDQAEQASRRAVDLSDKLPPQERYLIAANHAKVLNDNRKAIEAYENLAKISPENSDVRVQLAKLYEVTGAFDKARDEYAAILARDPKYLDVLHAMGRVEDQRGNPQGALEYLNRGVTLAVELENDEQRARLLNTIGVTYRLLNKPNEALRNYEDSLATWRRLGQKRGIASALGEIALIQKTLGKRDAAWAGFSEALQLQREIGDKKAAGITLINMGNFDNDRGRNDEALSLYKESLQIQRETANASTEALCLNNIGTVYQNKGQYDDALTYFQQALQIREKLGVPSDIAQTLHNLSDTLTRMGQYDQALSQSLRAVTLYRDANNKRGMAIESSGMGTIFLYQGRYGAALNAKEEALKTLRSVGDRGVAFVEVLGGYGDALTMIGRGDEAQESLREALTLASEIKNQALIAQTLDYQGDRLFYAGDYKGARALFTQASQVAAGTKDDRLGLQSRFSLAKVAVKEARAEGAIASLRELGGQADTVGLKQLSTEASAYLGEALIGRKDYARAAQVLETALAKSEKLGLRALLARNHYLLGRALLETGRGADASRHFSEARRIAEEIRTEAKTDDIKRRDDLSPLYKAPTS